jgi:hypothetical protein
VELEILPTSTSQTPDPSSASLTMPQWDRKRRRLYFRGALVKAFTSPAKNQVTILDVFEKRGWPSTISSPLKDKNRKNLKKKLENAIHRVKTGFGVRAAGLSGTARPENHVERSATEV